jgi:hypothetical protein
VRLGLGWLAETWLIPIRMYCLGMVTVFLDDGNTRLDESWVDIRIRSLHELIDLLNEGFHVHRPDEL